MKKASIRFFFILLQHVLILQSFGMQGKYWVFFSDKNGVTFDPYQYFDPKAIERRIINHVPLSDYTDWPVRSDYLLAIAHCTDSIRQVSRWFNAVAVCCDITVIRKIKALTFVRKIAAIRSASMPAAAAYPASYSLPTSQKELMAKQLDCFGAEYFYKKNIDGKGVRIAIFDAGFPTVDANPAFEHIRRDQHIIKTWDFVQNKEDVYGHSTHGMMVLSCIAGMINDEKTGLATSAEFLLARTEMSKREPFSEEENWLAAVEWADKNGAQIINSSLAYTYNRYFPSDMNGRKSMVAKAANIAASKGMLVINAAGNDGMKPWKIIGTPADADSVLTVGGINPYTGYHINFSSYGPTADYRIKPNVCAFAQVIVAGRHSVETAYGTSFASPLVAGFAACALQMNPHMMTMELFHAIEQSANLFPYYDYAHGYGVPQAAFFTGNLKTVKPTFTFTTTRFELIVSIIPPETQSDQRKAAGPGTNGAETKNRDMPHTDSLAGPQPYLYYHIENNKGFIEHYYLIKVEEEQPLKLLLSNFEPGEKLMVHFQGYTKTYNF